MQDLTVDLASLMLHNYISFMDSLDTTNTAQDTRSTFLNTIEQVECSTIFGPCMLTFSVFYVKMFYK